jgi:carbon monoxide dehydrogenase subunit G
MIQISGQRHFAVSTEVLFGELSDLQKVIASFPEAKKVKSVTSARAEIVVSPGLSFVKGDLDTVIEKQAEDPPHSAMLLITSKGIGSSSKVHASFQLARQGDGTDLTWKAEVVELTGLLKLAPKGLVQGSGQKVIDSWLNNLEKQLDV